MKIKDFNRAIEVSNACYLWKFCYPSLKIKLNESWSRDLIEKAEKVFQEVAELKKWEEKVKKEQEKAAKIEIKQKNHKQKQFFEIIYLFSNRMY